MAGELERTTMNAQSKLAGYGKKIAIAATFGALCFFAGAPRAQAEDGRSCQFRVERAESRLRDAIEDHGYYSHQANDRRRDLYNQRQRCWNESHYWNGYNRWYNDHDRDDRYRDRDRDDRFRDRDRDWDHDRDRDWDHDRDRDWR